MNAHSKIEKIETPDAIIRRMAKDAVAAVPDNTEQAARSIYNAMREDKKLWASVSSSLIMNACRSAVAGEQGRMRAKLRVVAQRYEDHGKAGVVALANAQREVAMEYICAGGVRLRNATRDILAKTIAWKEQASGSLAADAKWLSLVMQGTPDGMTVGQVHDEQRLIELRASLSGNRE